MMATPVFGQRSGWHEDLLAGQLRADSVLLNSPILGLGSRIGRATDGVPLELALSKIVTPARLQPPSTRSGTDVASLLGSSSLLKSVPGTPAGTFTNSERQGAGDGATSTTSTGSRETPSQNKESKNGLSVFQAHTSALRAQLQDLHQSLEVPRAGWDKVEAHTVLAGTHSASAFASLSTFDGVAAAALAKTAGQTLSAPSGLVLCPAGQPNTDVDSKRLATTVDETAETTRAVDTTVRSIHWSPGAPTSVLAGGGSGTGEASTPIHFGNTAGATLSALGARRTPGRLSPLEGVRGVALSTESRLFDSGGLGEDGLMMWRTGSLDPGDDT